MINVALIGMGNIGLGYDSTLNPKTALSHAKAIYLHEKFTLKYAVDPNDENLHKIKQLFPNILYFKDYKELFTCKDIDVLIIATPTNTHFQILKDFEDNENIKLFFMEKPLFSNINEYKDLPQSLQKKLVVNYPRRFEKNFQDLKKQITSNDFGELKKGIIHYSKGFINNGSHAIDLLQFLCKPLHVKSSCILNRYEGFDKDDDSLDIFSKISIENSEATLHFVGFDHNHLTTFTIELFFKKAVIYYDDTLSKMSIKNIQADPLYPQYKTMSFKEEKEVNMNQIMLLAYEDIFNKLSNNFSYACNYEEEKQNVSLKEHLCHN